MSLPKPKPPREAALTRTVSSGTAWRELCRTEDYWAIWLGLLLCGVGLLVYLPGAPPNAARIIGGAEAVIQSEESAPFRTVAWFEAHEVKLGIRADRSPWASTLPKLSGKPHGWTTNPLSALWKSNTETYLARNARQQRVTEAKDSAAEARSLAIQAENPARAAGFNNEALNEAASAAINEWRETEAAVASAERKLKSARAFNQLPYLLGLWLAICVLFGLGSVAMGRGPMRFALGASGVFGLALLAQWIAAQANVKDAGLGYAFWAILLGLLISNTIGTPKWVTPGVQTEFFIKTGLVLLGAEILFGKIMAIGLPGIFVAWVVTPIVLVTTFIFGQRVLKIPSKTLNITISADMSVCGVSAAIATAAACRAKKEELTLAVGMSLLFTSVMMVVMPAFIRAVGMPEILGGAWIGGTIDATGAVAAAGEFLGKDALHVAATIKMIQNILIGVVAFAVATYWVLKVDRGSERTVGPMEIWRRFPKFVLGFIGMSIAFSMLYQSLGPDLGRAVIDNGVIKGLTKNLRGWFFCLAFVSIGLATDFRELKHHFRGGKPVALYLCGQTLNLVLTLIVAYLMFYVVFRNMTDAL